MRRFVYTVSFGWMTNTLQSPHPRETFREAWEEGSRVALKFAEKGMSVSISVQDNQKKVWDSSLDPDTIYGPKGEEGPS